MNSVIISIIILLSVSDLYSQDEWSVSTFNIRYDNPSDPLSWDDRKQAVVREIAYFDIVGLQEVLPHQLDYIENSIPLNSSYSVTRFGNEEGEACPILWKTVAYDLLHSETRWLSEEWNVVGSLGWDASLPRIVSMVLLHHIETGKVIRVINTHWSHTGEEARLASASLLRGWCMRGEADAVVLMGDFNAESDSQEIQLLVQGNLMDTYSNASSRCRKQFGTFTGFDPAGFSGPRIDYIFVDGASVLWTCAVENIVHGFYISDHLPVQVSLSW
jgi:endonuclease/exonuclease/phosphatase family metal-dependent hydrolase